MYDIKIWNFCESYKKINIDYKNLHGLRMSWILPYAETKLDNTVGLRKILRRPKKADTGYLKQVIIKHLDKTEKKCLFYCADNKKIPIFEITDYMESRKLKHLYLTKRLTCDHSDKEKLSIQYTHSRFPFSEGMEVM